jgi:hypothetical protein
MRQPLAVLALTTFAALAFPATRALASFIPPSGLSPGSQYQLIFITADKTPATSSNIGDYNTFVTGEAALNPSLPSTTWDVVGSTATVSANVNAPSFSGVPIFDTQGNKIVSGSSSLYSGSILFPIDHDQYGNLAPTSAVWTGSLANGASWTPNFPLGSGIGDVGLGVDIFTDARWIFENAAGSPSSSSLPVYALSAPITVSPTPEPATIALLGIGLLAIRGLRARRRQLPEPLT